MNTPSEDRARLIFGTDEAQPERRVLRAGPLSAVLESGGLRWVRWGGLEVARGIGFVVRDARWGTAVPRISDLVIEETPDAFAVRFAAEVTNDGTNGGQFAFAVRMRGEASGRLWLRGEGRSPDGFRTNRTGFVFLHSSRGVAGLPLEIIRPDGSVTRDAFPALIRPDQPALDIAGLRYRPAPGLALDIRFAGEVFEMEDQRNWTDPSFKTYCRPLARGFPYLIAPDETVLQEISLTLDGSGPPDTALPVGDEITVAWGGVGEGAMPELGLYADAAVLDAPWPLDAVMASLRARYVQARVDVREDGAQTRLARAARLAELCGCPLEADVIVAGRDPAAELAPLIAPLGNSLRALFVTAGGEGKAEIDGVLATARAAFPAQRLFAGVISGFTELNRAPPPEADAVCHATSAVIHAADDRSVMETLEALPDVVRSARALIGAAWYRIGPATIGMLGSAAVAPPATGAPGRRLAMRADDPRQRGLFGAAFLVGTLAACAGVDALTPGAPVGEAGLLDPDGRARPAGLVFAEMARLSGRPRLRTEHGAPDRLAALAVRGENGPELWLANLTDAPIAVRPEGFPVRRARILDAGGLARGTAGWIDFDATKDHTPDAEIPQVTLDAHDVLRLS